MASVYNIAANQTPIEPVSNYYKGKALRAGIRQTDLQSEALEQEISANLPERRIKVAEDEIEQRVKEYTNKVGREKAESEADQIIGITAGSKSILEQGGTQDDALAYANEQLMPFIENLADPEVKAAYKKMAADGFQAEELAQLHSTALAIKGQFASQAKPQGQQQADFLGPDGRAYQGSFDPATGQYKDADGNVIKGARPIAPQATQGDLADPRTKSQRGAAYEEARDAVNASSSLNELIATTLPEIAALPKTVGISGKFGMAGGGLLSAMGQKEMADTFAKAMAGADQETIAAMQTRLQIIRGNITALVTGEESKRLSETERKIASDAVGLIDQIQGPADLTRSYPQVVGALKQLYEESWARRYKTAMAEPNIPIPYDLSTKDGRIGLLSEFSDAGIDADSAKRAVTRMMAIQGAEI